MGEFIFEVLFEGLILGIFRIIRRIIRGVGILILKLVTWSDSSFNELSKAYNGSIIPYLVGFIVMISLVYLGIQFI